MERTAWNVASTFLLVLLVLLLVSAFFYQVGCAHQGSGNNKRRGHPILTAINGMVTAGLPRQNRTPFLKVGDILDPSYQRLEQHWKVIRDEALDLMRDHLDAIPGYGDIDAKNRGLGTHGDKYWKTFVFKYYQDWNAENCQQCPRTAEILRSIPGIKLAMFSILERGKKLYPHVGPFCGVGRVHLPLIIPSHGKAYIMVGGQKHYWTEGKLVMLNDTYEHSVDNPDIEGGCDRVILFIDVVRSDLPKIWRFMYDLPMIHSYFNSVNAKTEAIARRSGDEPGLCVTSLLPVD